MDTTFTTYSTRNSSPTVPVHLKVLLSIKEAACYTGIGENKLRELVDEPNCPFAIRRGSKWLIHRKNFEKWLEVQKII